MSPVKGVAAFRRLSSAFSSQLSEGPKWAGMERLLIIQKGSSLPESRHTAQRRPAAGGII